MDTLTFIGIVGSLRVGSANGALACAALTRVPDGVEMTLHDVADIPLYNGDVEAAGLPDAVARLVEAVDDADGLLFFSPEYNVSLPAVTKNVIDWLSRRKEAWEGTATTMLSTSPGRRAGLGAREHFSSIMQFQAPRVFDTFGVGEYSSKLSADNEIVDEATLDDLATFLTQFAAFTGDPDS